MGNISKEVRHQPSSHATILLGYLPVAKLECYRDTTQSLAGYRLFHFCMSKILEKLKRVGEDGVEIVCGDGFVRLFYLILAAYVADYPEQCLVACCMENWCPKCTVSPTDRENLDSAPKRDPDTTSHILSQHQAGGDPIEFEKDGIRAVYSPFWKDLPRTDIFNCFTPDLLHQLHKGVFKDHLVKWCSVVIGEAELDTRFKTMSPYAGLHHFKKGISTVTQWTGTEHKEMEKVFLSVLAGGVDTKVLTIARAILDFIYYLQLQLHTTATLAALENSLRLFHENKQVLVDLEIREHFNIPKLHAILHYVESIRQLGSTDGYNTESPERLHIDYAKSAYRASNKRDYIEQMAMWLQRQESMWIKDSYLMWTAQSLPGMLVQHNAISDDLENDGADDDGHGNDDGSSQPLSQCDTVMTPTNVTQKTYRVAKTPPFRNCTLERIASDFGAVDFLPALKLFLATQPTTHGISIPPNSLDRFNAYRQIVVNLPENPYTSNKGRTNRIRTLPATAAKGRKLGKAAVFDTALVIENKKEYMEGKGLSGAYSYLNYA